jgi:Outer membrane protein and related peptidoglycan-associated (lipo)proteins
MANKAAATLDEKPLNVEKGISAILSSLLAMYLKTHDPEVNNIIREAGNLDIVKDMDNVCQESLDENQRNISDRFLQAMLGDKAADFTAPIAETAGLTKVATNRLIYMLAPVVAGYLGEKLVKDKWSETRLLEEIRRDKPSFVKSIPAGVVKAFGLEYIIRTDEPVTPPKQTTQPKKKSNNSWIWWLLLILALLLLFFGWRSCKNKKDAEPVAVTQTVTTHTNDNASASVKFIDLKLPNGVMLKVYKDGVEDRMIRFLNSDEYKNATNDQLKEKWFVFRDIDFEFNSATELKAGADKELDNITAIMKAYSDAKIRVAGFADKKGTEAVNLEISKLRAKTIEDILDKKGITSQVVRTEGFGEEFAKHSEAETDDQRAEDRDIALRFVK